MIEWFYPNQQEGAAHVHLQPGNQPTGTSSAAAESACWLWRGPRRRLILKMMQIADCGGIRVNIITEQSSLSRPAVSRHLNILKDAGLIKLRREGTKNYYYFDTDPEPLTALLCLLAHTRAIMGRRPERREQPL